MDQQLANIEGISEPSLIVINLMIVSDPIRVHTCAPLEIATALTSMYLFIYLIIQLEMNPKINDKHETGMSTVTRMD